MGILFRILLVLPLVAGCDNSSFGGSSDKGIAPPKASPSPKPDPTPTPETDAKKKTKDPPEDDDDQASDDDTADDDEETDKPAKPDGPGSDLTLTINDKDSKLDVFQVSNSVSKTWLPLTWQQGTQTIPKACSPKSKTKLSLKMHARGGLFSSAGDLTPGTCSAPTTQAGATTVNVGLNPNCGSQKASFSLSCAGSSSLEVVP